MLLTETKPFYDLVRTLRTWPPEIQHMALYASLYWTEERLAQAERDEELPSGSTKSATILKLVKQNGE